METYPTTMYSHPVVVAAYCLCSPPNQTVLFVSVCKEITEYTCNYKRGVANDQSLLQKQGGNHPLAALANLANG